MLKPLLRTIPILSGNVKLACYVSNYKKIANNEYSCYVRQAKLFPLSSVLSQRNIEANLLYSTYDYDLSKFYAHYSQYFYDDVFEFDKKNYIEINESESQKNRNTDFEFGCKRVSYEKNETQFAFYCPIYLESLNDIPDSFNIHINIKNEHYNVNKTIKVKIKDDSKLNYLYIYLKKYLKDLDSNVVFCNSSANQAVYYGIDLESGGCVKKVDNIIAKIFNKQNTINNFDAIISNGFKRNNIAIRQILPLCFYFNVNEILTKNELQKFRNSRLFITGEWVKDEIPLKFYDIDMNYQYFYEDPYVLNPSTGNFHYKKTNKNILNIEYPSLNESMYIGYRYSNKVNLKYNRWKLKYSDDSHPYITNLSPAFSINQGSTYRYGYFPEKYHTLPLITDIYNNIIVPVGNSTFIKESPYYSDINLLNNYYSIMNNNCSTWYTLLKDDDSIYDKDIWKNTEDDKVYYNGILYNFYKIYNEYPKLKDKIDKFSVLTKIHFNPIDAESLKDIKKADTTIFMSSKYMTDKTAWITDSLEESINHNTFDKLPEFYLNSPSIHNGNAQLVFDKIFIKNENHDGDFVDMLSLGLDIYELNIYYKYSDILKLLKDIKNDELLNIFSLDETLNEYFIDGFEILPIYSLNNMLHENNKEILFERKPEAEWILENLYFSQHGNYYKTPYDRDTFKELIKEYGDDKYLIPIYINQKFISKSGFISILYEYYGDRFLEYYSIFDNISKYEYHPRMKDDTSATYCADVFTKKDNCIGNHYGNEIPKDKKDNDVIFLDPYNINKVVQMYNVKYNTHYSINIEEENTIITYAKFLNMKHLLYYISDLYKDENNTENMMKLFNSLFIKKRVIYSDLETKTLDLKDQYIHISKLYNRYRPITLEEKLAILDGQEFRITVPLESKENLDNDMNQYGTGIYIKTSEQYSGTSHVLCNNVISIGGYTTTGNEYSFTISFPNKEYHDKDFYYIPTFYIRESYADNWQTNDSLYKELFEYIKDYIYEQDNDLYQYLTESLITKLEKYEVDEINLNDITIIGSRQSKDDLGFNTKNSINQTELKNKLKKIKKILKTLIPNISNTIYYKNYIGDGQYEYKKYNNYTGINDFVFLDNIYLKKELIKENIYIPTYVINDEGEFVKLDYNSEEFCVLRNKNDEDYNDYIKSIISHFATDIVHYEGDNYFKFSQNYLDFNNIDSIVDIPDINGVYDSDFAFEVVYRKKFVRLDENIFDLIHLDDSKYPYKDLYLYRFYKENEYPTSIKIYYTNKEILNFEETSNCLYPLFDDIHLQDKEYSVIYSEYNQSNIYEITRHIGNGTETNYRYNSTDIKYMLDISELNLDLDKSSIDTYDIIDTCYSTTSLISDDLGLYDKFKINTKTIETSYTYAYTYSYTQMKLYDDGVTSYNVLTPCEGISYNTTHNYYTYGFIMIDGYCDNTKSSFNIVDKKYKSKKYFTSINNSNIYEDDFDINTYFNLLVPFSKMNLYSNLLKYKDLIIVPNKYNITTYYKQNEIIGDNKETYAYNINYRTGKIDSITLQRYFDSIVPYIKETNILYSSYCLKYKNYKYPNNDVNYLNDVFYSDNINIYNYDKLRVYDSNNSYTLFEPTEYKFLNDSKLINLEEKFEIIEPGTHTYEELIQLEKEEYIIEKFKKYILKDGLNAFDDNQILFLYNRYKIIYDTNCVGLNLSKTDKLYTLKYKFSLK